MSHQDLYQNLRAALLERRFVHALQRRVYMYTGGAVIRLDGHDFTVSPDPRSVQFKLLSEHEKAALLERPRAHFAALTPAEREAARWTDEDIYEENPWLHFAPMVVALAVEQRLGHAQATVVLDSVLQSLAGMFRFGGAFAGYPIRWDPAFSPIGKHIWFDQDTKNRSTEFLPDGNGYGYANPPSDFRQHHRRSPALMSRLMLRNDQASLERERQDQYDFKRQCRQWEVSQDEFFGMVTVLWAIATITADPGLRARAAALLRPMASYLSAHGYLLVRPRGGLVPRGHGESLVGAELALQEAFDSVLGARFAAATDWLGAMRAAGYAPQLEPALTAGAIAGLPLGWAAPLLATVPLVGAMLTATVVRPHMGLAMAHPLFGAHLGQMLAICSRSELFDPYQEEGRGDPALSFFLHQHPASFRYELYCDLIHSSPVEYPVTNFVPFQSLFGLDRSPLIRDRYFIWFDARRAQATQNTPLFSLAVACLLAGDGRYEEELADRLDTARVKLASVHHSDLPLGVVAHDGVGGGTTLAELPAPAIDYMGALALAWWHRQRRGANTYAPFPAPPTGFNNWRKPLSRDRQSELYPPGASAPARAPVVAPDLEVAPDTTLPPTLERNITVPPTVKEVDTGIDIEYGDSFSLDGSGTVSIFGAPQASIGVAGLSWPAPLDPEWPVHTGMDPNARQYALAARLNGWFMVGQGTGTRRWQYLQRDQPASGRRRLYLRVNQPDPQLIGASGAFRARLRIWKAPATSPIHFVDLVARDWDLFPPRVEIVYGAVPTLTGPSFQAIPAQLTLTVRLDGGPWELVHGASLPLPGTINGPVSGVPLHSNSLQRHVVFWRGPTDRTDHGTHNGHYEFRATLLARGVGIADTVACKIHWHGQRIQCVRRPPRGVLAGLAGVGGLMPSGRRWYLTVRQALEEIERGQSFYVEEPTGDRVEVMVDQTLRGKRFLRTVADGDKPNNLLSLPSCP